MEYMLSFTLIRLSLEESMRRIINILVFIPILIIGCNKSNKIQAINKDIEDVSVHVSTEIQEQKNLNKIMYVNSPEGLRVRNLPNVNGDRIGLLDYLTEVKIVKEDNDIVSIEGIEGKWVNIITPIEGWVFNGYLTNVKSPRAAIVSEHPLATWQIIDRSPFEFPLESRYNLNSYFEFTRISYSNGVFVGACNAWTGSFLHGYLVYSSDGVTWNVVNKRWRYGFSSVTYGNGMFLAIGANGQLAYSYNGAEWFTDENQFPGTYSIIFGNNRFITWTSNAPKHSDDGRMQSIYGVAYSDDGKTWAIISASDISEGASEAYSLTYTNGRFYVALSDMHDRDKVKIAYSTDSVIWNVIESETFGSFNVKSIIYGNGRLLVFSCTLIDEYTDGGANLTYSDDDGRTWHLTEAKNDYKNWGWINEITFVNGYFIAVGYNQKAAYSRDGINWINVDDPNNYNTKNSVHYNTSVYGNSYHIIAGTEGMIRVSQWSSINIE
jgi:hypothetical protein